MSEVEPRPSPIHGTGLFACRPFAAGERLATYAGPIHAGPPTTGGRGLHAMALEGERWIDGSDPGNLAQLANHSCAPNAEAVADGNVVHLVARRDLAPGEEITFDYGLGLADALGHPCRCGAPGCARRIVAEPLRPALRRHLRPRKPRD